MRQQLRLRVLVPVAVLALLALGYGAFAFTGTPSEEPDPTPASTAPATTTGPAEPEVPRLTHREWRKQANAVCAGLAAQVAALGEPTKPEQTAALLPTTLAAADKALAGLRTLTPAKRDAAKVARMLKDFARFVKLEKRAADALTAGNIARYARLNDRAFGANDHGSAIAEKLGARACAAGSSSDSKLARTLDGHSVVVAVLYTPGADLDALMVREARLGADEVHAGFVAIQAGDTRSSALLARDYGIHSAPAVLVFVAGEGAVATFREVVDRDTIAQAVENADL